jgi:flagellar hook-associated protein 2
LTPLTSVSGLASGIDFQSLADAILQAKRAPIRRLEQTIAANNARSAAYVSLEARFQSLQNSSRSLQSATNLLGNEARVSVAGGGSAPLSASARADSVVGGFDVEVLELAAAERLGGGTFASRTEALGLEGSFALNGVEVTLTSADTLNDVVGRINQVNREGPEGQVPSGVRATLVTVAPNEIRLVLASERLGAEGVVLDGDVALLGPAGLGVLDLAGEKANVLQSGSNARLRVDGIELTRDSNRITDALDGITLNLTSAAPDQVARIEVSANNSSLRATLVQFVEEFNQLSSFLQGAVEAGPEGSARGPLASDSFLRSLRRTLQNSMLAVVPGGGENGLSRLSDIGISLQRDGSFKVDDTRLTEVLKGDRTGVVRLLERTWNSSQESLRLVDARPGTVAGSYQVEVTEAATRARAESDVVSTAFTGAAGSAVRIRNLSGTGALEVQLTEGMTLTQLADQLNEALRAAKRAVVVEVNGDRLSIQQEDFGSARGFQLELVGDAADWLSGLDAGEYRGTDVVGTIDGNVATGAGRQLTATAPGNAQGLILSTNGTTDGEATFSFQRGVGAILNDQLRRLTAVGEESSLNAIRQRVDAGSDRLRARAQMIESRLQREREQLNRRFAAVEEAISSAQTQSASLDSQINQISNFQWGSTGRR